jgi:hypothetical protein
MYFEQKIIDGRLMIRTTPNGEWREPDAPVAKVIAEVMAMDPDARGNILRLLAETLCSHCGHEKGHPDCCGVVS